MDFLSNSYRYLKLGVATLGGLSALGVLFYGIFGGGGIIYIIGGSLWLVQTGFNYFDSGKVHMDIRKQVNELKDGLSEFANENISLKGNIDNLEKVKENFVNSNNQLVKIVERSEQKLGILSEIKKEYENENNKYIQLLDQNNLQLQQLENQNEIYINENKDLTESITNMKNLQIIFNEENNKYKELIILSEEQINQLKKTEEDYIIENHKLQESNEKNTEQLEILKNQIVKLRNLYNNSRELLVNLASAGDLFTKFNESIDKNIIEIKDTADSLDENNEKLDSHLNILNNLVTKLKDSKFSNFDVNNDGVITKEEFENGIKKL